MSGRSDYEERRAARIDRLHAAADKAEERSTQYSKESDRMMEAIPFGQPIITGRGARTRADINYRERAGRKMDHAVEESSKAAYYADRAKTAESDSIISSDDPEAVVKLRKKVESLESAKAEMKRINAFYRKHGTCKGCEELDDDHAAELDESMKHAYSWETAPYPSYELTSVNQRIKAAKDRIARLERTDRMPDQTIPFDGGEIVVSSEVNRVQIRFEERQGADMTEKLHRYGFHWAHSEKAFQRLKSPNALWAAKQVCSID